MLNAKVSVQACSRMSSCGHTGRFETRGMGTWRKRYGAPPWGLRMPFMRFGVVNNVEGSVALCECTKSGRLSKEHDNHEREQKFTFNISTIESS